MSIDVERPVHTQCPLCGCNRLVYVFAQAGTPVVRCERCCLMMRNPQPSDAELAAIYTRDDFPLKQEAAAGYLNEIERSATRQARGTRLLVIGPGLGNLLTEATARGYEVTGVEFSGRLSTESPGNESFDVAILSDVLEHTRDPLADLLRLRRLLAPGATLFLAVPTLDSSSARVMRERWLEFKLEHLYYFNAATLQLLLFKAGFDEVVLFTGQKALSTVLARRTPDLPPAERPYRLSVVMPVFNEARTFPIVAEQLLAKTIPGFEIELVIVESNSTDGTREAVGRVADHERVTVTYEDRPRGKGHAVRAGLARAGGDFVLIQDADLEYDLNDYGALLEPLISGRAAFVLGSRHGKDGPTWKVRHFADQVHVSWFMNLGHLFFTALFNVTYGTRLRDPFTMYKVFRRDCLYGLTFEANRFDFDWELVGKLVRAGYRPIEIPVNYTSRSFSEGKKVSLFRDPLTWIRACFKYRFVRLGKKIR